MKNKSCFFNGLQKKILSYLAKRYVYCKASGSRQNNLSNEEFCKRWTLANKYVWKLPIKVDSHNDRIRISDKAGDSIFLGRQERVQLYQLSVKHRLENLFNEYLLNRINFIEDDIIVDVGANIGELSKLLQQRYGMKAIAIEPEEREFSALRRNLVHSRTDFHNCAVWMRDEEVEFFPANETGDSSILPSSKDSKPIKMRASTLPSILKNCPFLKLNSRIKLLKLEAEGAKPEILLGATSILNRIDWIAADCGAERGLSKESTLIPVMEILQKHGFRPVAFGLPRAVMLFERVCPKA